MTTWLRSPAKSLQIRVLTYDWAMSEIHCLVVIYFLTGLPYWHNFGEVLFDRFGSLVFGPLAAILAAFILGLYDIRNSRSVSTIIWRSFVSQSLVSIAVWGHWAYNASIPQGIAHASILALTSVGIAFLRFFYIPHKLKTTQLNKVVFLGESEALVEMAVAIRKDPKALFAVDGVVRLKEANDGSRRIPIRTIRPSEFYSEREGFPDYVVYSLDALNSRDHMSGLSRLPAEVRILDAPTFYSIVFERVPLGLVDTRWLLGVALKYSSYGKGKIRRSLDLLVSLPLLVLSLPVLLLAAAAIKIDSKGPVLFRQERLGLHRRPITVTKLRTMVEGAERESGPQWAHDDDNRITRVGKVLRKTRIDEFPQLWNVVLGDMSLIGFRPIREHFADLVASHEPAFNVRFLVKPGLTGWAQVKHDYAGSVEGQVQKLEHELFYLLHRSLLLDLYLIFKTAYVMFLKHGT